MSDFLDLLLRPDLPDLKEQLPTKQVEVTRLSQLRGEPVVFTLKALPYGRVQELQKLSDNLRTVQILLAGCEDLHSPRIASHFGVPTPAEALPRFLLPGEIEDLSIEVERLCGYRRRTITEVKND